MRDLRLGMHPPPHPASPIWLGAVLALACACVPFESAQALDLRQAFDAAITADARLNAARATADAAAERLPQARSQLLPSVAFSASRAENLLDTTRPNPLTGDKFTTTERYPSTNAVLNLRQTLFRRQQTLAVDQAEYLVDDARQTLNLEIQNTGVRLSGAYFDALLATDQLELIEAQKISTTTGLNAARKALVAGHGTRTDVDQAQTRLDMVLAQEIEARQHVDFTRRQLQNLIGRAPDTLAGLDPARLQTTARSVASLNDLIAEATASSPEIRSLKARVEASRLEVARASAGHYPTLDLVAQISNSQSDSVTNPFAAYYNRSIGVQLNLPIYSGGYVTSAERQAAAQLQNAQAVLDGAVLDLSLKVEREYRNVTEGAAKIQALGQATRSAGVALESTRKSYAAGVRTLLDVLNADQELKANERNLIQARYNYITARIRLAALLGNANPVIEETNAWLR